MGLIVKAGRVPITVGDDTVYIKSRMDWGTKKRLEGAVMQFDMATGDIRPDIGGYSIALMQEMIVGWEGPGFMDDETGKPTPCTRANITAFGDDAAIANEVFTELGKRFPLEKVLGIEQAGDAGKKDITADGSTDG